MADDRSDPAPLVSKDTTERLREAAARMNAEHHQRCAARGVTNQDPPDPEEINRILGSPP